MSGVRNRGVTQPSFARGDSVENGKWEVPDGCHRTVGHVIACLGLGFRIYLLANERLTQVARAWSCIDGYGSERSVSREWSSLVVQEL